MKTLMSHPAIAGAATVLVLAFVGQRGYLGATVRDYVTKITSSEVIKGVGF